MKAKYFYKGDTVQTPFGIGEIASDVRIGGERQVVNLGKKKQVIVDARQMTIVRLAK